MGDIDKGIYLESKIKRLESILERYKGIRNRYWVISVEREIFELENAKSDYYRSLMESKLKY